MSKRKWITDRPRGYSNRTHLTPTDNMYGIFQDSFLIRSMESFEKDKEQQILVILK